MIRPDIGHIPGFSHAFCDRHDSLRVQRVKSVEDISLPIRVTCQMTNNLRELLGAYVLVCVHGIDVQFSIRITQYPTAA